MIALPGCLIIESQFKLHYIVDSGDDYSYDDCSRPDDWNKHSEHGAGYGHETCFGDSSGFRESCLNKTGFGYDWRIRLAEIKLAMSKLS